jgi:hypothetical protein
MAPVYADHPFNLISTPQSKLPKGEKVSTRIPAQNNTD